MILDIATLLGGITSIWFLYDKRIIIINWFKLFTRNSVNPLSLPDNEFEFIFERAHLFLQGLYLPTNTQDQEYCHSLSNHGVLKKSKSGGFRLTGPGKRMLSGSNA